MKEWECEECGFTIVAHAPPVRCPECQAPKHRFYALEDEDPDDDFDDFDDFDDLDEDLDWDDDFDDEDDF